MKRNRLLAALPTEEFDPLERELVVVDLKPRKILYEPREPVDYLYFPLSVVISFISLTKEGETVETGMVGNEGLAGAGVLLGSDTVPYRGIAQTGGKAARLSIDIARKLFAQSPVTHHVLLLYIHTLLTQTAQSVICNRFHSLEERIARWLLATGDRSGEQTFPYTHEFLSTMLGARRVSVTLALGAMERRRIIETTRGKIRIVERSKLEKLACECYFIVRNEMEAFFRELLQNRRN